MTTFEPFAGAPILFHDPDGAIVPFGVVADIKPVPSYQANVCKVEINIPFAIGTGPVECWVCGFKWVVIARENSVRNGGRVECPSCHYKAGWPWEKRESQ